MKKAIFLSLLGLISVSLFFSCANDVLLEEIAGQEIPVDDMAILNSLGFAESSIEDMGDYYLAEGDIAIPKENLQTYVGTRQAHTNIVVSAGIAHDITVKIDNGLKNSSNWEEAILAALNHYNDTGSRLNFRIVETDPDITISYGNRSGAWAYSSFPTGVGKPGNEVRIGTIADNLSLSQKVWLIAHEMCHNLGFRHTDYLQSYGGYIEGTDARGQNHVPGTPIGTTSSQDPNSVFNSGYYYSQVPSWDGFSDYDLIAINYLYPNNIIGPAVSAVGDHVVYSISRNSRIGEVYPYPIQQWKINGVLISTGSQFVFSQPGTYTITSITTYSDGFSITKEKEVKVFPSMAPDRIYAFNLELVDEYNKRYVVYDIAAKNTVNVYPSFDQPIYFYFLYRGTYDHYVGTHWDWYTGGPRPVLYSSADGSMDYFTSQGTYVSNDILSRQVRQEVSPAVVNSLSDLEVLLIYWSDSLGRIYQVIDWL